MTRPWFQPRAQFQLQLQLQRKCQFCYSFWFRGVWFEA